MLKKQVHQNLIHNLGDLAIHPVYRLLIKHSCELRCKDVQYWAAILGHLAVGGFEICQWVIDYPVVISHLPKEVKYNEHWEMAF